MNRISLDLYFMNIVEQVSKRSTCLRRQIGAILVKDKQILSTGFNGAPKNLQHCLDSGCIRDKNKIPSGSNQELCRAVHAEQNTIIQAALHGISTKDSTLYTSNFPCSICTKMIINSGILRIVFKDYYPDKLAKELIQEAKIEFNQIDKLDLENYK